MQSQVIIILRNPVERLLSHYEFYRAKSFRNRKTPRPVQELIFHWKTGEVLPESPFVKQSELTVFHM